jgi:hypothetical protein
MIGPGTYNISLPSTGKQILAQNKTEVGFYFNKNIRKGLEP